MDKSQFNIKISKDLLTRVKRKAIMQGKTLTEYITDLVRMSLEESYFKNNEFDSVKKFKDLEARLLHMESIVSNREYVSQKLKPFNNAEAINCTKFMRVLFDQEVKKRYFDNRNEAFNDLFKHIENYDHLSQYFVDRLKEIMLTANPSPWTGDELNELVSKDKCNCSIRKGLINWVGIRNCPSQQEICDKGEGLIPFIKM